MPGSPTMHPDRKLVAQSKGLMTQPPYQLDAVRRDCVLAGLQQACERRAWGLIAAHVRTNHVHAIVRVDCLPEKVMSALKAYASRVLNEAGMDEPDRRRWARHGSTRYLWTRAQVEAATRYVVAGQGEEMAVFRCTS
jgi:REP element-mobilizing transposase RayT